MKVAGLTGGSGIKCYGPGPQSDIDRVQMADERGAKKKEWVSAENKSQMNRLLSNRSARTKGLKVCAELDYRMVAQLGVGGQPAHPHA